jgi:hypothetical protein
MTAAQRAVVVITERVAEMEASLNRSDDPQPYLLGVVDGLERALTVLNITMQGGPREAK